MWYYGKTSEIPQMPRGLPTERRWIKVKRQISMTRELTDDNNWRTHRKRKAVGGKHNPNYERYELGENIRTQKIWATAEWHGEYNELILGLKKKMTKEKKKKTWNGFIQNVMENKIKSTRHNIHTIWLARKITELSTNSLDFINQLFISVRWI